MQAQMPNAVCGFIFQQLRFRRLERSNRRRYLQVISPGPRERIRERSALRFLSEELLGPFVGSRIRTNPERALRRRIQGIQNVIRSAVILVKATHASQDEEEESDRRDRSGKQPAASLRGTAQEGHEQREQKNERDNQGRRQGEWHRDQNEMHKRDDKQNAGKGAESGDGGTGTLIPFEAVSEAEERKTQRPLQKITSADDPDGESNHRHGPPKERADKEV